MASRRADLKKGAGAGQPGRGGKPRRRSRRWSRLLQGGIICLLAICLAVCLFAAGWGWLPPLTAAGWQSVLRLLFIILAVGAGFYLGIRAGVILLAAAAVLMVGSAGALATAPGPALVEIAVVVAMGAAALYLLRRWRRDRRESRRLGAAFNRSRLSEENFRELFQNASDAIWIHDLEGRIVAANRADEEMVGYSLDELLGRDVREFLPEDARQVAAEVRQKLLKGEQVEPRYEQRLIRKDGTEATIEVTTRLIRKAGRPIAFQNIARDVSRERNMQDSLRFALQKVLVAQEEERKRIARELHDVTAQSILLLIHRLDAIVSDEQLELSSPQRQALDELLVLTRGALGDIRRFSQELRPAILDDLGLTAALEWLADNFSAEDHIRVDVAWEPSLPKMPHPVQLALFRIAQEAFANIRKHAGATRVFVRLRAVDGKIRMVIDDNGRGFEHPLPAGGGKKDGRLGLIGMEERAQLLGGTLDITTRRGRGTVVTVIIPLDV